VHPPLQQQQQQQQQQQAWNPKQESDRPLPLSTTLLRLLR
jgi:hypothetical protein